MPDSENREMNGCGCYRTGIARDVGGNNGSQSTVLTLQ